MTIAAGLDVGGAHLKVALVDDKRLLEVRQIVCPLWQGLDRLEQALEEARGLLQRATRVAVTMTGELSDLFPDRRTGVETLVRRIHHELGSKGHFWIGPRGLGSVTEALAHPSDVGSTNFLATAALVGQRLPEALVIDFGSTTADVIPVREGRAAVKGLSDAMRQSTGELVYTGLTRTAVMGVSQRAPFQGQWVTLAREYLATMADVRRVLGAELEGIDLHSTADGKGKSRWESVTRLARMLGRDASEGSLEDWQAAAAFVREEQLRSIHDGALLVASAVSLAADAPVVAAGLGADEIAHVASRLGRRCVPFSDLCGVPGATDLATWATACAPATALALLIAELA